MNLKKNNAMESIDITEKLTNNSEDSILIVDDSKFSRKILNDILLEEGFCVITEARNGKEAVELAKEKKPKYVFLDVEMPVLDGLGALPLILEAHPGTNVIMCTAMGQQNIIEEAVREGAKDYILKPYKKESIVSIMNAMTVINNRQVIPFDRGKRNQDKATEATKIDFNIEEISAVDNLDICKEELELDPIANDNNEVKEVIINLVESTDEEVIEGLEAPVEQLIDFILSENKEVLQQEAEQAYIINEAVEGILNAIVPVNDEQPKAEQFQVKLIKVEPLEDEQLKEEQFKEEQRKEEQRIEDALKRELANEEELIKEFISDETIKEGSVEEGTLNEGHISSEALKKEDHQAKDHQAEDHQAEDHQAENDQEENDQEKNNQEEKPVELSEEIEVILPEDIVQMEDVAAKGFLVDQEISEEKIVPLENIFHNEEGSNSSVNRFDYLWMDRLENRKRESFDPVFDQNRISSYSLIHSIENNNSQMDLKQSGLMLGLTSAYLCINGRLQPEHYFPARPGLFEQEGIIVFTDSILPRRCKAKAPLTMTEILKLAAKKKQHNANYLSNAIVHLVEGKIDRLLS